MSDQNQNEKAVFVNCTMKTPKSGGDRYCWIPTIDLEEIKRELGTQYVNARLLKPKKIRHEDDRLLIFSASDPKYLPRKDGQGSGGGSKPQGGGSDGEVEL